MSKKQERIPFDHAMFCSRVNFCVPQVLEDIKHVKKYLAGELEYISEILHDEDYRNTMNHILGILTRMKHHRAYLAECVSLIDEIWHVNRYKAKSIVKERMEMTNATDDTQ